MSAKARSQAREGATFARRPRRLLVRDAYFRRWHLSVLLLIAMVLLSSSSVLRGPAKEDVEDVNTLRGDEDLEEGESALLVSLGCS